MCRDIMVMRRFADTWERMKRDKSKLSKDDWEFLEWADAMQEGR